MSKSAIVPSAYENNTRTAHRPNEASTYTVVIDATQYSLSTVEQLYLPLSQAKAIWCD